LGVSCREEGFLSQACDSVAARPSGLRSSWQSLTKVEAKMLSAVEFQATVKNGFIQVPDEYKSELEEGIEIKVIALVKKKLPRQRDIIDELTENPVKVDKILTREEIYER
jgi:plasmid replication initiation protein